MQVNRQQVLAYRVAAQQLDRVDRRPSELAVLDLGVQDTPYGSARTALAARTTAPVDDDARQDDALELVWAARGAPHLHRRADLPALAAALWPIDDADATARIATGAIREGAKLGLAAFLATARAFREVVTAAMAKGEVSTAVSARVPAAVTYDCPACAARHISGALFQQAGLAGGVRVQATGSGTTLAPLADWADPPPTGAGVDPLLRSYLRLLGPATLTEVAGFLGTAPARLRRVWPDDLAPVRVAGRAAWLPADRLAALRGAEVLDVVRLLPPADPYLQARDRSLLLPDRARQVQVWRPIGSPGAVLVAGELAGTWRARMAGKGRLEIDVTPFGTLDAARAAAVRAEGQRLAALRGARDVLVRLD